MGVCTKERKVLWKGDERRETMGFTQNNHDTAGCRDDGIITFIPQKHSRNEERRQPLKWESGLARADRKEDAGAESAGLGCSRQRHVRPRDTLGGDAAAGPD